jgi:hypothetical protein
MKVILEGELVSIGKQNLGHNLIYRYIEVKLKLGGEISQTIKIYDTVENFNEMWSEANRELQK